MRRLAVVTTWLALGCVDQQPTQPALVIDLAVIQAHSPAHHGVSPGVSVASTPGYTQLDAASATGTAGSLRLALRQAGIAAAALDVAASFVVVGDAGCPALAPGVRLGVQVQDAQTL